MEEDEVPVDLMLLIELIMIMLSEASMVWYDMTWWPDVADCVDYDYAFGGKKHGMIWYDMVTWCWWLSWLWLCFRRQQAWYDMIWYDMTWWPYVADWVDYDYAFGGKHGMVWYDMPNAKRWMGKTNTPERNPLRADAGTNGISWRYMPYLTFMNNKPCLLLLLSAMISSAGRLKFSSHTLRSCVVTQSGRGRLVWHDARFQISGRATSKWRSYYGVWTPRWCLCRWWR